MDGTAVYHCISRTVAGDFLFDETAKECWCAMLKKVAAFSGVEVLAYCMMSNHFHVLVRVTPLDSEKGISREELLRRYRAFYALGTPPEYPTPSVLETIIAKEDRLAEAWVRRLEARMGDVSEFMKTLKQRFTIWYNATHRRYGTLWSERFKSVLIEDSPMTLSTVAAYIDLNPVRAGLADDPASYRWCSYAAAKSGQKEAQAGLVAIHQVADWAAADSIHQRILFGSGTVRKNEGRGIRPHQTVDRILKGNELVEPAEMLRCRLRFLSQGVALGSRKFIKLQENRFADREMVDTDQSPVETRRKPHRSRSTTIRLGAPLEASLTSWKSGRSPLVAAATAARQTP